MYQKQLLAALAAALISNMAYAEDAPAAAAPAAAHPHWSYDGAEGPDHWSELESKYSTCSTGKNQSPINLTDFIKAKLEPIKFDYKADGNQFINNGHTVQVNFHEGSNMSLHGHQYGLKQFHVHSPSENQINGKTFPMEAHFVHADANGNLAVIAVMFEEGKANPELEKAWKLMPQNADEKVDLKEEVLASAILPKSRDYYRFNGSLTTPPCTEGVTWLVMKHPVTASKEQIEHFQHVMHHHNNRPIQPINARMVLE